eukprot:CAMPEP_0117748994 /NCGR_PEP_ID=MMETSP0947-20121206/9478_1 /TAXON_ID=44440 /ORGANISM="Chattonella subsalsa, Strain CCMP2191" /LENGTH=79 /DNA_ID=CAMNT_0005566825 /DNA_START=640 /DNA_END=879 /DNA_ORIENTATION=+
MSQNLMNVSKSMPLKVKKSAQSAWIKDRKLSWPAACTLTVQNVIKSGRMHQGPARIADWTFRMKSQMISGNWNSGASQI